MIGEVLHKPHVIPGVKPLKPDPIVCENIVIGVVNANKEGDAKDHSQRDAVQESGRRFDLGAQLAHKMTVPVLVSNSNTCRYRVTTCSYGEHSIILSF